MIESTDSPIRNTLVPSHVSGYGDDMNLSSTVVFGGNLMVSLNGMAIGEELAGVTATSSVTAASDTNSP